MNTPPRPATAALAAATDTTGGAPRPLRFAEAADGEVTVHFAGAPGLYQLTLHVDAREFAWDELYVAMNDFGNSGERTGPWDFAFGTVTPLVPSWWASLDGEELGLWYCARVSLADMEAKCFRAHLAFHVADSGEHALRLRPYRAFQVAWTSLLLEPDPVDRMGELPPGLRQAPGGVPLAAWTTPAFWEAQRRRLAGPDAWFAPVLDAIAEGCMRDRDTGDNRLVSELDLPFLVALYHLRGDRGACDRALALVDRCLDRPHWGREQTDAYRCDGDMGAALLLRVLAWAWHALGDDLGTERRERLRAKLALQGTRFFRLILVDRDYWGGSVLQDHGWRSLWSFGTAALHLYGVLPEAETWLRYLFPRLQRSLEAMPRDGVIPPSSYWSPYLYLGDVGHFRWTLKALGGPELLDHEPLQRVLDFLWQTMRADDLTLAPEERRETLPTLAGEAAFFAQLHRHSGDPRAACLFHLIRQASPTSKAAWSVRFSALYCAFWAFFCELTVPDVATPALAPRRRLVHFADSGLAFHRDEDADTAVAVQCGPWCGHHAYRQAWGPCDRMLIVPAAGQFTLFLGGRRYLATADSGYKLQSLLGACMLVDDHGQTGDVGYPMSIPDMPDRGEHIRSVRWDEGTGRGEILLELRPAYPAAAGVAEYTRLFLVGAPGELRVRDTVVLRAPRRLAWVFNADSRLGVQVVDGVGVVGTDPRLTLAAAAPGVSFAVTSARTPVVYSYSSSRPVFHHVRFAADRPLQAVCVDFVCRW